MAYKTIPWPNVPGVGPAYSAQDWQQMQRTFGGPGSNGANSGVIWTTGFPLRALASDPASMTVNVGPGSAFVNGLWADSDALVPLTLNAADPTYGRIDLVVLRSDANNKTAVVALKTGTPDPSPTPPALDQTGSPYYEIPLAQIEVGAGVTVVHDGNITDARRFHNGAADHQIIPTKTIDAITRGQPVIWESSASPTDPYGIGAQLVGNSVTNTDDFSRPFAGIALEDAAAGAWVPVLTRGLYLMPVASGYTINTFDLVSVTKLAGDNFHFSKQVAPAVESVYGGNILGMTMSWLSAPPGTVWVYVNPAAFYGTPHMKIYDPLTGTNATTASTSYTNIAIFPALSLLPRYRYLEVSLVGCVSNGGAGNNTFISVAVDGVDVGIDLWVAANSANYRTPVNIRTLLDLSALAGASSPNKTYSIQPRWKVSAGTSTFYNIAGEAKPVFMIREAPLVLIAL